MRAFALMREPEHLEATFRSSPPYVRNQVAIEALRSALPAGLAMHYRGIGRFPFTEYPERGPGWQGDAPDYDDDEPQARELLLTSLGPYDYVTPFPRAFLASQRDAATVHAAMSRPQRYELVELCTGPESPVKLLGFDVGYWGGGNFSILCDAALWPTWHPATSEAIPELSRHLERLNQHALFPTLEAATEYTDWYIGQNWAEGSPEDFVVVAVGIATSDAG